MSWVLEGFDASTDQLVERIELSEIEAESIVAALGNPPEPRFAVWPVTRELLTLLELRLGRAIAIPCREHLVEYQVELRCKHSALG
jgi:hypothetical protein